MLRTKWETIMKTLEEICTLMYPSELTPRLPMKEAGLPLHTLIVHGYSMMRWRLDNQDGFADSSCSNVGEARHCIDSVWSCCWRKSLWRIDLCFPQNGTSPCGTLSILDAPIGLTQCCRASKLVCGSSSRGTGGLRLRHGAVAPE
jgi:hypothetical protein